MAVNDDTASPATGSPATGSPATGSPATGSPATGSSTTGSSTTGSSTTGLSTVGMVSRRTGLSVHTVRFWSDSGLVPPSGWSAGGYRLYDAAAVARFDLVRTLRDLGVGLEDVKEILAGRATPAEVAGLHARALPGAGRLAGLRERLELLADPRVERYWLLLALLNGRISSPTVIPEFHWVIAALRAHG
ncbi:MerR family transcriptional regulator [Sphaerisporangium sp. B11E5]|uniref:MerR family transcriptional regulator n=1 Tax=Sphaerisporangium sp. B11E5 TaxID=3153563 RepID=UPI00325D3200